MIYFITTLCTTLKWITFNKLEKQTAIDQLNDLIDEVDLIRENIKTQKQREDPLPVSLPENEQKLDQTSQFSAPILKLSSDIDEIMVKNLLLTEMEAPDDLNCCRAASWINIIKAFPLERNVKQNLITTTG